MKLQSQNVIFVDIITKVIMLPTNVSLGVDRALSMGHGGWGWRWLNII